MLKQMLGLDEKASEGDILFAVQHALEQAGQRDKGVDLNATKVRFQKQDPTMLECEDESRVEKIRARVRQLNTQFGDEITPLAMFDIIMREFARERSRKD